MANKPNRKLIPTRNSMSPRPSQRLRSYRPIATMIAVMTSENANALGTTSGNNGQEP